MSSKGNGKSRKSVPATLPGAVSVPFEDSEIQEPEAFSPSNAPLLPASPKDTNKADAAAKAAGRKATRSLVPGATMMAEGEPPLEGPHKESTLANRSKTSKSTKASSDRKVKRVSAATVPGAVTMAFDDTNGVMEPEAKITTTRKSTKGPNHEPELVDEFTSKQQGKSRGQAATTPGVVRVDQRRTTVATASYGMTKPALLSTGEVVMPGAVSVTIAESAGLRSASSSEQEANLERKNSPVPAAVLPGAQSVSGRHNREQDAAERRKDPRPRARRDVDSKKSLSAGAVAGASSDDSQRQRMEAKIMTMEEEIDPDSGELKAIGKETTGDVFKTGDEVQRNVLKSRDDDEPTIGLLLPEESPDTVTAADHGLSGAPDVVSGTTRAPHGGSNSFYGNITDEGLAVAIAVEEEEEEEELFFPAAIEYDPDSKPPIHKNRRFRVYAIGFILLFIVVVIGVVVGVVAGGGGSNTFPPSASPTASPSSSSEGMYRQQFIDVVGDAVMLKGSPYDKAANWMISNDSAKVRSDAPNWRQRYLLALFYFLTTGNGKNPWRTCNPPVDTENDSCEFDQISRQADDSLVYIKKPAVRWLSGKHECEWVGIICDETLTIRVLEVWGQNITGTLPVEIAYITSLQSISLAFNELTGTLPTELSVMKYLLNLEVHYNMLTGTLSSQLWAFNALQGFNVGGNLLSGTIGTDIGRMTDLKGLHLFENMYHGTLPTEIGNLGDLTYFRLFDNSLNGTIPTEVGRLTLLEEMLMNDNMFSSNIPSEIGLLQNIGDLRLHHNGFNGTIPEEFYNFPYIYQFDISNAPDITGTISTSIGKLTSLEVLRLSSTRISGTIPSELGLCTRLVLAWLHRTELTGSMPLEVCVLNQLQYLQTDCNPDTAPAVSCLQGCCTSCCDRTTQQCVIL